MATALTFRIHADSDWVSISLLEKTLSDVRRLLRDVDYSIEGHRSLLKEKDWIVTQLHSSVPTITMEPRGFGDEATAEILVEGLHSLTEPTTTEFGLAEPPDHFNDFVLEDLKRMRRLFIGQWAKRAKTIEFSTNGSTAFVNREIDEQVARILRGGYWNLGSIEGNLDAINLHGNPTLTIWDRVSRMPVRCSFSKQEKEQVKNLLEKRVLVIGEIHYFRNGIPRAITKVTEIRDMTRDNSLPKARFGSLESSEDSVEFIRSLRE
jgi:hypothetical protein